MITLIRNIPIREEFDSPQGALDNVDTFDQVQRAQIPRQQHVNVRSFVQDAMSTSLNMLYLDTLSIATLNASTMEELGTPGSPGEYVVRHGEQWTGAVVIGKQTDRNDWRGLTMTCEPGMNTATSVIK